MQISVSVETDYNIEDEVYVVNEVPMYNNLYRNETIWRVRTADFDGRGQTKYKIKGRVIEQYGKKPRVYYDIDGTLYSETEIFKDLEKALAECKERNNRGGRVSE